MDNEKSDLIVELFRKYQVPPEFVPPGDHRTNPAERAIKTVKNHVTSSLATWVAGPIGDLKKRKIRPHCYRGDWAITLNYWPIPYFNSRRE